MRQIALPILTAFALAAVFALAGTALAIDGTGIKPGGAVMPGGEWHFWDWTTYPTRDPDWVVVGGSPNPTPLFDEAGPPRMQWNGTPENGETGEPPQPWFVYVLTGTNPLRCIQITLTTDPDEIHWTTYVWVVGPPDHWKETGSGYGLRQGAP